MGKGGLIFYWLKSTELEISSHGDGDIVIAGEVEKQSIELSGLGNYNAPDLQRQTTVIINDGPGNAVIWVEDILEVEISGAGDVSYFGVQL